MSEYQHDETESDTQMPLSMLTSEQRVDGAAGFDSGAFAEKKSGVNGAMLLVVLLIAAAGVLGAMRMTSGVPTTDASIADAERKIDQALKKLATPARAAETNGKIQALLGDTDSIITMFANDPSRKQVSVDQLAKNPFELFVTRKAGSDTDPNVKVIDKLKAERLKKLKDELAKLSVQSVLQGRTSLAVVSGKVLREGDSVGSFTVTQIGPFGVRLTADGNTYTLLMDKPAEGTAK
jgi:hypothetical protein